MTNIFSPKDNDLDDAFLGDKLLTKPNLYVGDICPSPRVSSEWRFHCSWNR